MTAGLALAADELRDDGPCACCGAPRLRVPAGHVRSNYCGFHGWCARCYRRWVNHGKPASGPPPVRGGRGGRGASQLDDYEFLCSWGYTREQCAGRLGVTLRTIGRYEARLRERREASRQEPSAVRGAAQEITRETAA